MNFKELEFLAQIKAIENYLSEFCAYEECYKNKSKFEELTKAEVEEIVYAINENEIQFNKKGGIL